MLIEHLRKALQSAHDAGDMKLVSSIAKMIQDLEAATSDPSAAITPGMPPQTPGIAAVAPPTTPEPGEPLEPPEPAPGPLYLAAQAQLEAAYPGHEFEDELEASVVIEFSDGNTTKFLEIPVTVAADGTATLGEATEVTPAGEPPEPAEPVIPMTTKTTRAVTARGLITATGGPPPTELRIWSYGAVETTKGVFTLTRENAVAMVEDWTNRNTELHFDYEHGSYLGTPGQPAPAAAWFTLETRDDGLYATNIRWTDRAAQMVSSAEYRYFSPTFNVDENDVIIAFQNMALTNSPATHDLQPLVAANTRITALETDLQTRDAEIARLKREQFSTHVTATRNALEGAGIPPSVISLALPLIEADFNAVTTVRLSRAPGKTEDAKPGTVLAAALLELAKTGTVPLGEKTHTPIDTGGVTLSEAADAIQKEKPGMRRTDAILAARKKYPHLISN